MSIRLLNLLPSTRLRSQEEMLLSTTKKRTILQESYIKRKSQNLSSKLRYNIQQGEKGTSEKTDSRVVYTLLIHLKELPKLQEICVGNTLFSQAAILRGILSKVF